MTESGARLDSPMLRRPETLWRAVAAAPLVKLKVRDFECAEQCDSAQAGRASQSNTPASCDQTHAQFFPLFPSVSIDSMRIVDSIRTRVDHPLCTYSMAFRRLLSDASPCSVRIDSYPGLSVTRPLCAVRCAGPGTHSARHDDCYSIVLPLSYDSCSLILDFSRPAPFPPCGPSPSHPPLDRAVHPTSRPVPIPRGPWAVAVTLLGCAGCSRCPPDFSPTVGLPWSPVPRGS
jgi:hypothetical protein